MNVQPRMAGQYVGPGDYSMKEANEYNTLKRRFGEANSVSVKQQGGTMQDRRLMAAAVAFCVGKKMPVNEESVAKVIPQLQQMMRQQPQQFEQLVQDGEQMLQQVEQQASAQPKTAKLGAKLEYLNKLKGICPEGTEKVYLQKGGCMCKPKAAEGAELKKKKQPKNEIQKFKAAKGCKADKKK